MVVAVADETTLQLVQRVLPAFLLRADAGRLIVAGIGPCLVPCGLPEAVVGLVHLPQHLTDDTQVEQRLAVVGVGVTFLLYLDSSLQIALSLLETGPTQIPQAHLHITAIVQRIATQRLLIIVEGTPCGVTILLQVQTCEVQLVHGLGVLWRQSGLSGVRYRTYLLGLSMPLQQGQHPGMLCAVNGQRQLLQRHIAACHMLLKYLLRRQRDHLIIILFSILSFQQHSNLLFTCSKDLKGNLSPLPWGGVGGRLNIQNKILRGLLHHAQLSIGHEVLCKLLLLVGHQPREVGLVLSIYASHQFDVRTEALGSLIREIAVPRTPKVTIAPRPLLLAWREMVRGHM